MRGVSITTMNENGGAFSYLAGKFILTPVLFVDPSFYKK